MAIAMAIQPHNRGFQGPSRVGVWVGAWVEWGRLTPYDFDKKGESVVKMGNQFRVEPVRRRMMQDLQK